MCSLGTAPECPGPRPAAGAQRGEPTARPPSKNPRPRVRRRRKALAPEAPAARDLGEFGLIRRIREAVPPDRPPLLLGPGDDAALLAVPPGEAAVLTVDTLNEGVHFDLRWMPPFDLGRRAQVQSLSDIAAMGARPLGAVVALCLRPDTGLDFFDGLLAGLLDAAREYRCPLAGGNLARSPGGGISISTSTLGSVVPGAALRRDAARPGHEVWITGVPGSASAGLSLLLGGEDPAGKHLLVRRFLRPVPRLSEAAFLRDAGGACAAIDLSDGLRRCAALLAGDSRVRAVLDASLFPRDASLLAAGEAAGKDPASWALDGGEDFELLVTAPPGAIGRVRDRFERKFSLPLTRIGSVEEGEGLEVRNDPGGVEFTHF